MASQPTPIDSAIPQGNRGLLVQLSMGMLLATLSTAAFKITQAFAVGIDHGDIVFFADQAFSDAFADATSAQNQDFHN